MGAIESVLGTLPPEVMMMVMSAFVFVSVAGVTIAAFAGLNTRRATRERLEESKGLGFGPAQGAGAASRAGDLHKVQQFVEHAARKVLPSNQENLKRLRQDMIKAGLFDPKAVGIYFLARIVLAVAIAGAAFFAAPLLLPESDPSTHWLVTGGGVYLGYFAPTYYLRHRIKKRVGEHRDGFPDFLDLLVVCADAGLSTEAAIDRVARELALAYPSLSTNLSLAAIEMRAGGTMLQALDHLSERLGLDEARSFATLLQQSEEYGSSLTDSLRVYSEDMRHARMSRAEEKANSLPSRMTLPLMMFIFPVILVVVILPVIVRFAQSSLMGG